MDDITPLITGALGILFLTSFVKFATVLSIARYGLGLGGAGFGIVIVAVSLGLSFLAAPEALTKASGPAELVAGEVQGVQWKEVAPFLTSHSDPDLLEHYEIAPEEAPQNKLLGVFLLSELRDAFSIGLLILLPLVLIDLLVTNALMLLGVKELSVATVSLPLKLLLFVLVDGWTLIVERCLSTYIV